MLHQLENVHDALCHLHLLTASPHAAGQTVTYDVPYFNEQLGEHVVGNQEPFCAELFNRYGHPYAFLPLSLRDHGDGFPVWVSVQIHEVRWRAWRHRHCLFRASRTLLQNLQSDLIVSNFKMG